MRLGLIINPLAGLGGPAGLKGSDNRAQVATLLSTSEPSRALLRAARCLSLLAESGCTVFSAAGPMGGDLAQASGLTLETLMVTGARTSAVDTRQLAQAILQAGVDLLLFAGGDGTARDICSVVGEQLPVLGIPAGVKMHSGVFALSPEAAAEVVLAMIRGELVDIQSQEVRDIDEALLQQGRVNSRYFGSLRVPSPGQFVQSTKQGGREVEELVIDDIVADLCEQMEEDTLYLIGAGTTNQALMDALGLPNTLLGVDVVLAGELVAADVSASQLEQLLLQHSGPVQAMLSITANQGALIGRGNQQLSPMVLRRLGREGICALATKGKLRELAGRPLLLDTNDPQLDREWSGYIEVVTGYHERTLYPLGLPAGGETV
ncbi:ATP-NAD kinase [Pseudomaricurvus sp. HS19]|nr:ATP-NAD kinase [Pseudomaricurvus sp. HS19]